MAGIWVLMSLLAASSELVKRKLLSGVVQNLNPGTQAWDARVLNNVLQSSLPERECIFPCQAQVLSTCSSDDDCSQPVSPPQRELLLVHPWKLHPVTWWLLRNSSCYHCRVGCRFGSQLLDLGKLQHSIQNTISKLLKLPERQTLFPANHCPRFWHGNLMLNVVDGFIWFVI